MLKILDTFAGAGGFSLGFEMAGCRVVGAIERDKWASETFQANHPGATILTSEIELVSDDQLLDAFGADNPDVVLGGPPCQGFSICNKNAGDPKDPRNSLFNEFLRVVRLFEPQFAVMENVPNLLKARTHDKEHVLDIIRAELEGLGYYVYPKVLEAVDFGVPQIRKRLFVLASQEPLDNPFPSSTHTTVTSESSRHPSLFDNGGSAEGLLKTPTLWEAISDLPVIEAREGGEEMGYDRAPENDYQGQMRQESERVFNHKAMHHTKRTVSRFASMGWGDSIADVPDHLKPYKRNGKGEISDKVYDQNNRRMHPDKPCHTIPASFYANFVHPYLDRNFTAREGARIQSFPDHFIFKGKPTVVSNKLLQREGRVDENYLCQYNQIGNAVPPLVAKAIAENLVLQHAESSVTP